MWANDVFRFSVTCANNSFSLTSAGLSLRFAADPKTCKNQYDIAASSEPGNYSAPVVSDCKISLKISRTFLRLLVPHSLGFCGSTNAS